MEHKKEFHEKTYQALMQLKLMIFAKSSLTSMHILNTKYFPGKIIPEQHILHKHCVPYIQRHGYALGRDGEQGTESSHQTISKIEKSATAIVNKYEKLKFIMTTQLLNASPVLKIQKEKKKRKRKNVQKQ